MYLWPNDPVVAVRLSAPVRGNNIMGSKAVTAIGMASVIHQMAIHKVAANIATPSGDKSSGLKKVSTKKNNSGPKKRPKNLVIFML